jgi:ribonuclease T
MNPEDIALLPEEPSSAPISQRFRGFLPIVVDVESGGFNHQTDAILEIAASIIEMNDEGQLIHGDPIFHRVVPFEGANIEESALKFLGMNIHSPFRIASEEKDAITDICQKVRKALKKNDCKRAVLVGHNAWFDLQFLNSAIERCDIKRNPFHPFTSFDTATLAGLAYGQTVLARACQASGIEYDGESAHSARYDVDITAQLFCNIVNQWQNLGGWPL